MKSNRIREIFQQSRILFLILIITGCLREHSVEVKIVWKDNKATAIILDSRSHTIEDEVSLSVQIADQDQFVLGEWSLNESELTFTPIVPFTPGMSYDIYDGDILLDSFLIDNPMKTPPQIIAIYPTSDTVPENLLKMYLQFSSPMTQGRSLQYIDIIELETGDTLEGVFLDLQPELWNEDNSSLTLWLDPGRIKRGLIPNQELGNPLHEGSRYEMIINENWRGTSGLPLGQTFSKKFVAAGRDESSPLPEDWEVIVPDSGTNEPLVVIFGESLDAVLAIESIQFFNSSEEALKGRGALHQEESVYEFYPELAWIIGNYTLEIETRLEDLAGNNINRLFDQDINGGRDDLKTRELVKLSFEIK